ncbi:hypothetical protein HQ535_01070, partial [bacterium]|nr:hypothetical protein [bacterium]
MRRSHRCSRAVAGLILLALLTAACSGDGGFEGLSTASTPGPTTSLPASTTTPDSVTSTTSPISTSAPTSTTSAPTTTTTGATEAELQAFVPVLTRSGEADVTEPPMDPSVVDRSRDVTLSPGFVETLGLSRGSSTVVLDLFDDTRVVAAGEYRDSFDAGFTWQGKPVDGTGDVLVVVRNGEMTAHVSVPGGAYEIRPLQDGRHSIVQFDPTGDIPDDHVQLPSDLPAPAPDRGGSRAPGGQTVVDIMVLWTPAAEAKLGGADNIRAEVDLMVLQANAAYENSDIDVRLRLAASRRVGYTEAPAPADQTSSSALGDLMNLTCVDGWPWNDCPRNTLLDGVHEIRDDKGADLVALIVERDDFGGLAWSPGSPHEALAFSVIDVDFATSNVTFAHEVSHNLSAGHDRGASQAGPGDYANYAAGHVEDGVYRTVMAYWSACPNDCPRALYYSSPDISVEVAGTVFTTGSDRENNSRAINEFGPEVALYRERVDTSDRDRDGVADSIDICPDDRDPDQIDTDADGAGDACDADDDGDEIADTDDAFPLQFSVCNGLPATILGSRAEDVIEGTDGDDVIMGLGGGDQIDGLAGHDHICGGGGND